VGSGAPISEPKPRLTGRRIILTTFGSLGDLHPYIAVALGLKARGHEVVIATTRHHEQRIERRGIGFHPVRPAGPNLDDYRDAMRRIMDPHKGSEYVIRELVMPALRDTYEDLLEAAQGADLLTSHVLTYATRLVAEKKGVPWVATFLQPLGFFSAYDPPVLPQIPFLSKLRFLGPAFHRLLFGLAKWSCRSWAEPWHQLRAQIGLPATWENPLFEGLYAPSLVLAMFSPVFADKQRDWPPQTVVSGFPFDDQDDQAEMSSDLARFLDAGPPPVVFTLGSSGVYDAGVFYENSAAAARLVGRRAVLIVGDEARNRPTRLPDGIAAFDYVPFSSLFPRAAAIVHAGGIGTTSLAMRCGRPMLIMPCAHDQFDNAARVTRLGIARTIPRRQYSPTRVATELRHVLDNREYARRAAEIGERVCQENGVRAICDALDDLLRAGLPVQAVAE